MGDACILHGLSEVPGGYAQRKVKGKAYYAHRLAYCADRGVDIGSITGQVVRHSCDNPRCINPNHLLLGTHQDDMDDKSKRRRVKVTKLTDEQLARFARLVYLLRVATVVMNATSSRKQR